MRCTWISTKTRFGIFLEKIQWDAIDFRLKQIAVVPKYFQWDAIEIRLRHNLEICYIVFD